MRHSERGISLAEVLVALTVLGLATVMALMMYDGARRSFKTGDNLSEQQQIVRIAFDILAADLRAAGYNHNPDGDPDRPDEQIELALATAIVLRIDRDEDDPVAALDPEEALAGGAFSSVSTGNDELVAYYLAKPGGSSPDSIAYDADVAEVPRDGDVEPVTFGGVDLDQDDPPYTLYRRAVNPDGTAAAPVPLVDHIARLRFTYFDLLGVEVPPVPGDDDAAGDNARSRASIRRIGLEIVGLTRDGDARWSDPADPDPDTRRYRKFRLAGDLSARNLGSVGFSEVVPDTTPPSRPDQPSLVSGHCDGLIALWNPNPTVEGVVSYRVLAGPNAASMTLHGFSVCNTAPDCVYYVGALDPQAAAFVLVEAVDGAGNISVPSPVAFTAPVNRNTPETPSNPAAATFPNGIRLSWDPVVFNDEPMALPAEDPIRPELRDLAGYRIYRESSTQPSTLVAEVELASGATWLDRDAVACRTYDYRVAAADRCWRLSPADPEAEGTASGPVPGIGPGGRPEAPVEVEAFLVKNGADQVIGGHLEWAPVIEDEAGDPVYVEQYNVYRAGPVAAGAPPTPPAGFGLPTPVTATEFDELFSLNPGETVYYTVTATTACVFPADESDYSAVAEPTCSFDGDVVINDPTYRQELSGNVPVEVEVVGGTGPFVSVKVDFIHQPTGSMTSQSQFSSGPVWNLTWDTAALTPGPYRIRAEVLYGTCTQSGSVLVEVVASGG